MRPAAENRLKRWSFEKFNLVLQSFAANALAASRRKRLQSAEICRMVASPLTIAVANLSWDFRSDPANQLD